MITEEVERITTILDNSKLGHTQYSILTKPNEVKNLHDERGLSFQKEKNTSFRIFFLKKQHFDSFNWVVLLIA